MISIELKGRLGNHLFQYALCRVVAEKNNYEFSIPNGKKIGDQSVSGSWLGSELFNCSLGKKFSKQTNTFSENKNSFSPDVFNIGDGTHLNGYWQSEKYFNNYEDKIREWYKIDIPDTPFIGEEYCVIHYRAQDAYLRENIMPTQSFFECGKNKIKESYPNIKFVVISDNPTLAFKKFKGDIILNNDKKTDFSIILHSKNKIISNSSFSWWSAWLGARDSNLIIAPNRWMNYNFNLNKDDIFYPNNIRSKYFNYI